MNEYHFSAELAKRYGVEEAIVLHNLAYWVKKNAIDGRNIHDGRAWTYSSQEAFTAWFPWWSRRQIQRIMKSLEQQEVVIKSNYNTKAFDRTLWYTVCDEVMEYYRIPCPPDGLETTETWEPVAEYTDDSVESTAPNGAAQRTERCDTEHETVRPIPKNKPNNKPKETLSGERVNQEAQFKAFWDAYPRKEGKKKALEKWKRLNPDPDLFARIMAGLDKHIRSEQWRRGVIPHPTTWLNGERWEDELPSNDRGGPEGPQRIDPGEGYRYV